MTSRIGVRELKNQASRVIRSVREEMAEYVVTLRGEPVAVLRPLTSEDEKRLREEQVGERLRQMRNLASEVAAAWISEKDGIQLVVEQRR